MADAAVRQTTAGICAEVVWHSTERVGGGAFASRRVVWGVVGVVLSCEASGGFDSRHGGGTGSSGGMSVWDGRGVAHSWNYEPHNEK
eukprot:1328415-Prymnesium_polylepis.1